MGKAIDQLAEELGNLSPEEWAAAAARLHRRPEAGQDGNDDEGGREGAGNEAGNL